MRRTRFGLCGLILALVCLASSIGTFAQGAPPSSIQVFLPGGGIPTRVLRLVLAREDGTIDTVFTDSKGKYMIATPRTTTSTVRVTIDGDNQTYDTTTAMFRLERGTPNQTNIFLKPLSAAKITNGVFDVASYEGNIPGDARKAYKRALNSIGNSQFESAIGDLKEAVRIYPAYLRAVNDLGVVFMKLDRLDEAADTFRRAIEINKRFFHPRMNLGIVLRRQGRYQEAIEILEPLYNENHGMLEVRLAYAKALEGMGRYSDAEQLYRSALTTKNLAPEAHAELQARLGLVLNREEHFADAVPELEKAIELNRPSAMLHFELGTALIRLQRLERAEFELIRSYELGGNAAGGAQLLLGRMYYSQRRLGEAQRAFEQYLKDVPTADNALEINKLIADLKAMPRN